MSTNDTISKLDRRRLMRSTGIGAAALVAGGASLIGSGETAEAQSAAQLTDVNILNFALNLEYLEAEFYQRAAFGIGLSAADTSGQGQLGTVIGPVGTPVPFVTPAVQQYAQEIAADELAHVRFLRAALGSQAVAEPTIDVGPAFTKAAIAAGVIQPGQTFNPYADEASFLLGAFIFEDVGVTAYHGAAPYLRNRTYLSAAAGILAVEAYHASEVRLQLFQRGLQGPAGQISAARASLSGAADDQGIVLNGMANIVPTDSNSIAFARTPSQVANIVYLGGAANGYGFFPNRLNGALS